MPLKANGNFAVQLKGDVKMKRNKSVVWFVSLVGLMSFLGTTNGANAQAPAPERRFLTPDPAAPAPVPPRPLACTGPISRVIDVADENLRTTTALFGSSPGGGEGGQFDKTPVLSTKVTLVQGMCLDAHVSAIVGSKQSYGRSALTLFQVALTRPAPPFGPRHMVGHYHTPYGIPSPAVALEAEHDVDMFPNKEGNELVDEIR
jgi:hypothetical protein